MNYPTNLYNDLFSTFYSRMLTKEDLSRQRTAEQAIEDALAKFISRTDYLDIDDKIGAYASEVADCAFKKGFQLAVALFTAK